jgi:hypothetical protein
MVNGLSLVARAQPVAIQAHAVRSCASNWIIARTRRHLLIIDMTFSS